MNRRTLLQLLAASPLAFPQAAKLPPEAISPVQEGPLDYICPMDPDIRSNKPGVCSRCGMKLVLGIPDGTEYLLDLTTRPRVIRPGEKVELAFRVIDPRSAKPVSKFEIVHEKLFHLFIVSQDLQYFVHDHPRFEPDGVFRFDAVLPKGGMYRILGDMYPAGGTPQLIAKTIFAVGASGDLSLPPSELRPQLEASHCSNMDVELVMEPAQPISGMKALLFFKLKPGNGLEKYLGAWGHMLAASDDLIDMIHSHPFLADGGPQVQFNMIFPRARTYRIWVQFQREGVVNTAAFNVPVSELK
jgi:hypothetical protein